MSTTNKESIDYVEVLQMEDFLSNIQSNTIDKHLIVDVSKASKWSDDYIVALDELSQIYARNSHSLVLVAKTLGYDDVPETLNIAPTIQEAHDIIEFEALTRNLNS